jgi:hypothetical protein
MLAAVRILRMLRSRRLQSLALLARWRQRRQRAVPHRLAFGIERIGAAALATLAALGITRLQVDDSLSQLFRSDTPQFKQYEEQSRRFPSSEFDVPSKASHSYKGPQSRRCATLPPTCSSLMEPVASSPSFRHATRI